MLFLSLHRVHTWVERNIERMFFAPWHRNEESLRRFVGAAGHFEQAQALCRAFVKEARRFAGGADAALYLGRPNRSYCLAEGSLDGTVLAYEDDDLALALMRAERGPVNIAGLDTALSGILALPMLDHGKLVGFLLLERRPDRVDYRPDEIALLGWAAHEVGLDLQAMRASDLEAELASMNAKPAFKSDDGNRPRPAHAANPD